MDPHEIGNKRDKQLVKKQLVCGPSRYCTTPVRSVGKLPNRKEHMDSCIKLLKFVADSDLTLTQVNGQRKLGPPSKWTGPPPSPKCEIFVGSIPRNYYEPEIVKIFSSVGQIYELRLMMDFSGTNRGYCFIMYTTEEEAIRAVKELDQFEIFPGKKIGVVASVNNRRLYINQLPTTMDTVTIVKRFYEITEDIENVAVYRNLHGFVTYVLVSYNTHRGAAMGRRRLVPESLTLFPNCEVIVEWAHPNMTPWNVVLCILTLIFIQNGIGIIWVISVHGWLFLSFFYVVSYIFEDQSVWTEAFALGFYIVLTLLTALMDLSKNSIMPFILAGVLIADLVILVITKRE